MQMALSSWFMYWSFAKQNLQAVNLTAQRLYTTPFESRPFYNLQKTSNNGTLIYEAKIFRTDVFNLHEGFDGKFKAGTTNFIDWDTV